MSDTLFPEAELDTGATFSPCRLYRYLLWRKWSAGDLACFLMLNPSTADEINNDPTIERCERRTRVWGYGGLLVCNLFAYRATDPAEMKRAADPVGPGNDAAILDAAMRSVMVIAAWGGNGAYRGRETAVLRLLTCRNLHCLRVGKNGQPCHPLYMPYDLQPILWEPRP